MTTFIELPNPIDDLLRQAFGTNLSRAALEAMSIEGYRSGKLSRFQVQQILGFGDRWETEEWLGSHQVSVNYTVADLNADRDTLNKLLGSEQP